LEDYRQKRSAAIVVFVQTTILVMRKPLLASTVIARQLSAKTTMAKVTAGLYGESNRRL
jgi:hypothetical protein